MMVAVRPRGASLIMQLVLAYLTVGVGTVAAKHTQPDCVAFACLSPAAALSSSPLSSSLPLSSPLTSARLAKSRCLRPPCGSGSGWVCKSGRGVIGLSKQKRPSVTVTRSSVIDESSSGSSGVLKDRTNEAALDRKRRRHMRDSVSSGRNGGLSMTGRAERREREEAKSRSRSEVARRGTNVATVGDRARHGQRGDKALKGDHSDHVRVARVGSSKAESTAPLLWSKPVAPSEQEGVKGGRFRVVVAGQTDLEEAGALCIKVFFGVADNPWKAAQLRQLTAEQRQDLESRCNREESVMFKAVDTWECDKMVGFTEVSAVPGSKYGMGIGIPLAETRPVVSNLAVDPSARRCGIGRALMEACEDMIKTWNFEEIILQVEEDNEAALAFYGGMGFVALFVDRAARRYDTSGFLLQNVRTSKLTMRKALTRDTTARPTSTHTLSDQFAQVLAFVMKPFVTRPTPSPSSQRRGGADSMENLFGAPGVGRSSSTSQRVQERAHASSTFRLHRTTRR